MKLPFTISIKRNKPTKGKRVYEAADKGRRGKSFRTAKSTGVNREVRGALITLRDRSRHMVRNNGWCKRAVEAITKHTIGEGIQPAPIKSNQTKIVKNLWRDWATKTLCDWSEKTTFYGLQEQAMRAIAESGEVLIVKKWIKPSLYSPVPLQIQVLESDHIDNSRDGETEFEIDGVKCTGKARLGIQFDEVGKLAGYWLFDYHPGEGDGFGFSKKSDSRFFPKTYVLHVYEILRPGQVRGLPMGVAAFMKLSDFSDFEDAQLVKQKIAACYTAFVLGVDDNLGNDEPVEDLEPGVVEYLSSGQSVEFSNPPSVSDYDPYSTRILQGIAASYGITYEMLTMDYSKVNFTSGRMAKMDVKLNFNSWQYNVIVPQLCDGVWNWFIEACMVAGLVTQYIPTTWTAPRVPLLDPVKETTAAVMQIKNGLNTASEVIRENGREPEELFEEYKEDQDRLNELGITIESINSNSNKDVD